MKTCTKCGVEREADEHGKYPSCRYCRRAAAKSYYSSNNKVARQTRVSQRKTKRAELKEKIYDYLESHPCVDCQESDIVVLEFDHVRGKKADDVCRMAHFGRPWEAILEEIAKCDVVCCNCHRRRTYKRMKSGRFR